MYSINQPLGNSLNYGFYSQHIFLTQGEVIVVMMIFFLDACSKDYLFLNPVIQPWLCFDLTYVSFFFQD